MSKKENKGIPYNLIMTIVCIALGGAVTLVCFYAIFLDVTGEPLPWWAYIIAALIYALCVWLVYTLVQNHKQKFVRMLERENFHTDKRYEANGQLLCIDFSARRIANTYLATKPLVSFDEIVGYRTESFRNGAKRILPEDRRFVGVVLTVKRDDPSAEHPYLYLAMFELELPADEVPDPPQITEKMAEDHPELQPLFDLEQDIQVILQLNKQSENFNKAAQEGAQTENE